MHDILIVGGGPAGLTALLYARRAGLDAVLLEGMFPGGQMATTAHIENYPGFPGGVSGADLAQAMAEQAASLGGVIRYEEAAELRLAEAAEGPSIRTKPPGTAEDGGAHSVYVAGGEKRSARALILCMGATPRRLGVPGEERLTGSGVSYCATCDGAFFAGQPVAVIGGGDTAAEDALYLARTSSQVHLIHRRGQLRAQEHLVRRVLATPNITMHWNTAVAAMEGEARLTALTLRSVNDANGGTQRNPAGNDRIIRSATDSGGAAGADDLLVSGAFVAVGVEPRTALAAGKLALDGAGYILAGEDTRTSVKRVYAAGDCRAKALRQVVTAVADGAMAVTSALEDL